MSDDLPFKAEYAKSGRSACKMCKDTIAQATLRVAVMVQSPMFDGKQANWHHVKCFFRRNRPKGTHEIGHFDALRWDDQEKLRKMIEEATTAGPLPGKGGKKSSGGGKAAAAVSATGTLLKDFRVELAKSSGAACRICEVKIKKGEARIGKKDFESQRAKMYGPYDRWHHVACFASKRDELEYFDAGDKLQGFNALGPDDKDTIRQALKEVKSKRKAAAAAGNPDEPDSKKPKMDDKMKADLKKQMTKIYYYRDLMERHMSKKQLEHLLTLNDQEIPVGIDRMLDRISDCMMFGALEKCDECKDGQLVFRSGVGYECLGQMSEWTKCQVRTLSPKRKEFKLPEEFRNEFDFCKLYKWKKGLSRIVPNSVLANPPAAASATATSKTIKEKSLPLRNLCFVLDGKIDKSLLKDKIQTMGGSVRSKVDQETAAVISTLASVKKLSTKPIKTAKELQIQVVSEDVFDDLLEEGGIFGQIKRKAICDWGTDPKVRLSHLREDLGSKGLKSQATSRGGSDMFVSKDLPKSMKLKLKGGAYVDPESGLEHKAHVIKDGKKLFSIVLGAVNIQEGKNSYYKLQALKHDVKSKYYLFRSWGRVGTTIGGTKKETYDDETDCLEDFKHLFEDKTGNRWSAYKKDKFEKVAGKFFIMDLDMGGEEDEKIKKLEVNESKSKLDKAVQELVSLIFDIETMKKALVEFEIDLTKMPLGKLSKKQIQSAYKILTEVQGMIKNETGSEGKFLDASNRFFTLIPHDFGMKTPPLLDDLDYIETKIEMLDNLLEIELAYQLLQTSKDESAEQKEPIDIHYEKLNTKMEVLKRDSDEFKMLEKYVKNTHASTHNMYSLKVEQIFKVDREGENKRFAPYKEYGNRMLLWHGSRTTNFAGILSQGLRIAPPEAPVTGYMFGKGIYFADMVSKSANYCRTSPADNTGLLMLCDVALGNMYEKTAADYIEKLPSGMHSCKGVGRTEPDPKDFATIEDGIKVPFGSGVKNATVQGTSLLYNEYIIYDVNQCNAKYLFRLKFNYKY